MTLAPGHPAHARALITDYRGWWLLVRHCHNGVPSRLWFQPGGVEEEGESPSAAIEREIREELGVELSVAEEPLLYSWTAPRRQKDRGRGAWLFDCGVHDADDLSRRIRVQPEEISEFAWWPPGQALRIMHPGQAEQMIAVRQGRRYLEQQPVNMPSTLSPLAARPPSFPTTTHGKPPAA
jgi:ADP-ribose pyrophosphatase YjhB (NUDIX family)